MKKNKKITDMTISEASDYWDKHDLEEFNDFNEAKELRISLKKKKYIGIDPDLYSLIKNRAQKLHKDEDVLINEWLNEKIVRV